MNNSLENGHPWGKLVEIIGEIEIRQDTNIGFTVHAMNVIISAISLDDAHLAMCELQTDRLITHYKKSDLKYISESSSDESDEGDEGEDSS